MTTTSKSAGDPDGFFTSSHERGIHRKTNQLQAGHCFRYHYFHEQQQALQENLELRPKPKP